MDTRQHSLSSGHSTAGQAGAAAGRGASKAPLLIAGPQTGFEPGAEAPVIDLEPLEATAEEGTAAGAPPEPDAARPISTRRNNALLAAGIALAAVLGALAGASATVGLMQRPAQPTAPAASADATRALQASVTQLSSELASLKTGINTAQRAASTQFGKLAERLDRVEKAQAEPAAKLAKLQESIEKIDHRQQQAAVAAASSADITGSVAAKDESKPQVIPGWRLHEVYGGRAVVENRSGAIFEIGPGANVPGLGRIEAIRRENGRAVVVTRNGIIVAGAESLRTPPAYAPYRY